MGKNIKVKIIIRINAGGHVGLGHLNRNIALLEELRRQTDIEVLAIIKQYGPVFVPDNIFTKIVKISSSIGFVEEIQVLQKEVRLFKPEIFIVDHYGISETEEYFETLRKSTSALIVYICDFYHENIDVDILINQNIQHKKLNLEALKNPTCRFGKLLSGPDFFILKDNILKLKPHNPRKKINENCTISIVMGGTDPQRLSGPIVETISNSRFQCKIKLQVFTGIIKEKKANKVNDNFSVTWFNNPSNYGELLSSSDIIINSGGISKFESAFLGIPQIIITQNKQQLIGAQLFEDFGIAFNLGLGTETTWKVNLSSTIDNLACNSNIYEIMSMKGIKLVNGSGKRLIVKEIHSSLRELGNK